MCCGQYFNTLKDNCLVWIVIGCLDKRNIKWLREHNKLRRTGKHPQYRNSWRTEKTLCSCSIYNSCIFGCFDTRLCKLVSLYPYGIVENLIRFSRFVFQETVSSHEREIVLVFVYRVRDEISLSWSSYFGLLGPPSFRKHEVQLT